MLRYLVAEAFEETTAAKRVQSSREDRLHCPLTGVARRYTRDRSDNFDIFLPERLAKHNKLIFGSLFAIGDVFLFWQ
jgi:hypothetical protein